MPAYLVDKLVNEGVMTEDKVTRTAQHRRCTTCRARILAAIAYGMRVDVDPTPLNPEGELLALIAGRTTYRYAGGELAWRAPADIRTQPAGASRTGDVVPEHRCGSPPLPTGPGINLRTEKARPDYSGNPPF